MAHDGVGRLSVPLIPFDLSLLAALLAALVLTPLVQRLARATGLVAQPRSDRLHVTPTPYLGGLALLVALVAGLAVAGRLVPTESSGAGGMPPTAMLLTLIAGGAFLLGLIDDVKHLAPPVKMAGQVVLAMFFLAGGGNGPLPLVEANSLLGFLWVVGLMNACNFLDNMDGILTTAALVSTLGLVALGAAHGGGPATTWLPALAGALLGFLAFNRPPARIFMGDAGSLLIGVALAGGAWATAAITHDPRVWVALPLFLAYPLFDITFVTITRIGRGQPPWVGGRDHTNHRLLTRMGDPLRTLLLVAALQLLAVLAGLAAAGSTLTMAFITLGVIFAAFGALGLWLARVPVG